VNPFQDINKENYIGKCRDGNLMKCEGSDILLIYPPHRKIDYVTSIPQLSAYLKKRGYSVDGLDAPTLKYTIENIVQYVRDTKPKTIGVSIPFTPLAISGLNLIKRLNEVFPEILIIVGGVHVTLCPDEFTKYAYVCVGDGERALTTFLEYAINDNPNMTLKRILNMPVDIKLMATPDWGIVEYEKYFLRLSTGEKGFPVQTSVGCPFKCIFCSSNLLHDGKIRYKTLEQVDDIIQEGIKRFKTRCVVFRDENFTLNKARFIKLCNYLKQNNITWWAQTRGNILTKELAEYAKESGCVGFSIGVETGDPYIMKMIKKGVKHEDILKVFKLLKETGLRSASNFMIGHPHDTLETIKQTLYFADKIDCDYMGVQIATPFPFTEFRDIAIKQGYKLDNDWNNYLTHLDSNYTPPALEGYSLVELKNYFEWLWYIRKPSRFLTILLDKGNIRFKIHHVRRMFRLFKNRNKWKRSLHESYLNKMRWKE
jgi:radical SAM superfamily enzyme YgiQ (UPF0313 family)